MATHESFMLEPVYRAQLAGHNEIPPVDTSARGSAFMRKVGRDKVSFALSVSGLEDITEAHIHKGNRRQNGPVVAWLFGPSPGTTVTGLLSRGTIRNGDLVGPLRGRSVRSLVRLMNTGNAYVNVHTRRYPNGEIRGQVHMRRRMAVPVDVDWWQFGGVSLS